MYRLDSIVDRAIAMTMPNAKTKNITIIRNHSEDSDMMNICCDELHLLETMNNVLNNYIEAIKADGTIDVLIAKNNKSISILIRDNGVGISKENLPMVIEPFFSTKKRTNNYGLGLSYCYGVMNKHGGTIEISSEEGVGTTVELILPVR